MSAAQWTTTSVPCSASTGICVGRFPRYRPIRGMAGASAQSDRDSVLTSYALPRATAANREPINPVAPVISIVLGWFWEFALSIRSLRAFFNFQDNGLKNQLETHHQRQYTKHDGSGGCKLIK